MRSSFWKLIDFVVAIVIIIGLIFLFKNSFWQLYLRLESQINPCSRPLTYSLVKFDERFKISQEKFLNSVSQAENLWETALGKNLFERSASGTLQINLIYDYRQEATQKLQSLGFNIEDNQSSYDSLQKRYKSLLSDYDKQNIELETTVKILEAQKKDYDRQVEFWNKKGGAPEKEFNDLETQRLEVNNLVQKVNQIQEGQVSLVENINATVKVLNQLANDLNLTVDKYNTIGESRGAEFPEGEYKSDLKGAEINIYQFDNQASLVRVLTHELGHALGLDHLEDPQAIMYRLNEGRNEKISNVDLVELKRVCGVK